MEEHNQTQDIEEAIVTFRIRIDSTKGEKMKTLYPNYLSNELRYYKVKEMCDYYSVNVPDRESENTGFMDSIIAATETSKTEPDFFEKYGYEIKLLTIK
jgi:hypothetical protein